MYADAASTHFLRPRSVIDVAMDTSPEPSPTFSLAMSCPGSTMLTLCALSIARSRSPFGPTIKSIACHGSTTDSDTVLLASIDALISSRAFSTAALLPRSLSVGFSSFLLGS